jgi:hypothetical protein
MRIYFYDSNNRYIGTRELKENEPMPINSTIKPVTVLVGQDAHYVNDNWVITEYKPEVIPSIIDPTVEERIETNTSMLTALSGDFMGFMDWYFTTHPEEA